MVQCLAIAFHHLVPWMMMMLLHLYLYPAAISPEVEFKGNALEFLHRL